MKSEILSVKSEVWTKKSEVWSLKYEVRIDLGIQRYYLRSLKFEVWTVYGSMGLSYENANGMESLGIMWCAFTRYILSIDMYTCAS